ncbi:MAG: YceI family protein [Bacteroidetes bacterium]|nr:YceI family protein [Bacteroidota bacterium]
MKILLTIVCSLLVSNATVTRHFTPVDEGSEVSFKIKNFGFNVKGTFSGLNGNIIFNPDSLEASSFDVTVDAKTVNTGIDQRDNHLRKEEYFDAEKYPKIHFTSTKITTSTNKKYLFVFGNLTIKDITKEISFPFRAVVKGDDYLFEGEFPLNRRDFNVGGSSLTMSDHLTVTLTVLSKKK